MSTPSTVIAMGTGAIILTFCISASLVASFLVKCGTGLEPIVRLVLLQSSSFNCANVRFGHAFCSADSRVSEWKLVSIQSGVGASCVVRICFSPKVTTTKREGHPSSDVEITRMWSSGSANSATPLSPVLLLLHSQAPCGVRPCGRTTKFNAEFAVPYYGKAAGTISLFIQRGFDGQIQ